MENQNNTRRVPMFFWVVCSLVMLFGVGLAFFYDECYYPHPLENSILDLRYRPTALIGESDQQFSRWQYGDSSARGTTLPGAPRAFLGVRPITRYVAASQQVFLWFALGTGSASLNRYDPGLNQLRWSSTWGTTPRAFDATRDGSLGFAAFNGSNEISVLDLANGSTKFTLNLPNNDTPIRLTVSLLDDLGVAGRNRFYVASPPYNSLSLSFALNYPVSDAILMRNNLWTADSASGHVSVYETNSGSMIKDWTIPGASYFALAPNGSSMAVGATVGTTGSITAYDTRTFDKLGTYQLTDSINALGFSPGGSRLFTASQSSRNVTVFNWWDKSVERRVQFGAGPTAMSIY